MLRSRLLRRLRHTAKHSRRHSVLYLNTNRTVSNTRCSKLLRRSHLSTSLGSSMTIAAGFSRSSLTHCSRGYASRPIYGSVTDASGKIDTRRRTETKKLSRREFEREYHRLMSVEISMPELQKISEDHSWLRWADDPELKMDGSLLCSSEEESGEMHCMLRGEGLTNILDQLEKPKCKGGTIPFSSHPDELRVLSSVMTSERTEEAREELKNVPKIRHGKVFANNVTRLQNVKAYGVDFDYTLANYKIDMSEFIYKTTMDFLIDRLGYPKDTLIKPGSKSDYDPWFSIRGLSFDKKTGNLLKLDQFYKYNPRTIFHGKQRLPREKALEQYNGLRISEEYFEKNIHPLDDLFGLPEGFIYAHVIDSLREDGIDFTPGYVFEDVRMALDYIHDSGLLHQTIKKDPGKYMKKDEHLPELIQRLIDEDMRLFLLTNNSYANVGPLVEWLLEDTMDQLSLPSSKKWFDVFDLGVYVNAHKPNWFLGSKDRRFRKMDPKTGHLMLDIKGSGSESSSSSSSEIGGIYMGGCLSEFEKRTGLGPDEILYFGDSIRSDMTGPFKTGQWWICAICHELENEVAVNNDDHFRSLLFELMSVENLIMQSQHLLGDGRRGGVRNELSASEHRTLSEQLQHLRDKRSIIRGLMLRCYNRQFGSFLRTSSTRTLFFHKLARYSDLYTSRVTNMLNYGLRDYFQPRRQFYDHEPGYNWPM